MTPFASLIESQIRRTETLRTEAALERRLTEGRHTNRFRANLANGLRALARRLDPERGTAYPA